MPPAPPLPSKDMPAVAELAERRQWVCWRYVQRTPGKKPTKEPCQPHGEAAKSTDPDTWSTFDECLEAARRNGWGIGFVLTQDDPYCGIDLDDVFDDGGELHPWAADIVRDLNSYFELSPSRGGLRGFVIGELPTGRRRRGSVELYETERYLSVTGLHLEDAPEEIEEAEEALERVHARFLRDDTTSAPVAVDLAGDVDLLELRDRIADVCEVDPTFRATWHRQRTDRPAWSASEYDLSLATQAVNAGFGDAEIKEIIRLHRQKHGDAKKADRPDYMERTIGIARASVDASEGRTARAKRESAETEAVARAREDARVEVAENPALERVRQRFQGLEVRRVIRVQGTDDTIRHEIELEDGRRADLGSMEKLLGQTAVIVTIASRFHKVLPRMKPLAWAQTVQAIIDAAEEEEAGDEDPLTELEAAVRDYFDDASTIDWHDENRGAVFEALRRGDPIVFGGGGRILAVERFLRDAQAVGRLLDWRAPRVRKGLKDLGWRQGKPGIRHGNKSVHRNRFIWTPEGEEISDDGPDHGVGAGEAGRAGVAAGDERAA